MSAVVRSASPAVALSIAAIILNLALLCGAQQTPVPPDLPDAPSATPNPGPTRNPKLGQSRLVTVATRSWFFPDIADTPAPMSTGDKFKLFVSDSLSAGVVAESILSSAVAQARESPDGYNQGWDAYGKRFGSSMARRASSEFFGTFLLASALRQDPRFFPQKYPTLAGSAVYSLERVLLTRDDDGKDVANWSGLVGRLLSEGLANAYWPEDERTAGRTFERWGIDLATMAGTNMLRNYWPVLIKTLRKPRSVNGRQ